MIVQHSLDVHRSVYIDNNGNEFVQKAELYVLFELMIWVPDNTIQSWREACFLECYRGQY